jgi:hypothetical protein
VVMVEEGVGEDGADDGGMKQDGAEDVAGEMVVTEIVAREFDGRSYGGRPPQCSIGRVTMLILVMPASLMASMTEAKAPKGTRSSERT